MSETNENTPCNGSIDPAVPANSESIPLTNLPPKGPGKKLFQKGNKAAVGHKNPHADKIVKLKATLYAATSLSDMREVWNSIISLAKKNNVPAQKLFLSYSIGEPKMEIDATVTNTTPEDTQGKLDALFNMAKAKAEKEASEDGTK